VFNFQPLSFYALFQIVLGKGKKAKNKKARSREKRTQSAQRGSTNPGDRGRRRVSIDDSTINDGVQRVRRGHSRTTSRMSRTTHGWRRAKGDRRCMWWRWGNLPLRSEDLLAASLFGSADGPRSAALDDFPRDCRSESAVFNPHRTVVSRHSRCVRVRECVRYVRGFANDANTRLDRTMLFFFLYVTLRPLRNCGEATRRRGELG